MAGRSIKGGGGFAGLPRELTGFLAGLEANNTRDWFEAHRARYEACLLRPGLDLVAALSAPAAELGLMAVPRLNASLRRLNRDVRFSADKSPYRPHLHLLLSTGPDFNKVPGVHLVITATGFGHGAGHYSFAPEGLEAMRRAICDEAQRAELLALIARAAGQGAVLTPPDLARVPRGFAAGADWDHLLRRKHLVARTPAHQPLPEWLFTPDCVAGLMGVVADLAPLAFWLTRFAG